MKYPFDVITNKVLYTGEKWELPVGSRITCVGYGDEDTVYSSDSIHAHLFKVERQQLKDIAPNSLVRNLSRIWLYTDLKSIWSLYTPKEEEINAAKEIVEIPKKEELKQLLHTVATRFYLRGKASIHSTAKDGHKMDFEEWYKIFSEKA